MVSVVVVTGGITGGTGVTGGTEWVLLQASIARPIAKKRFIFII
jgi:hypothetical protein